MHQENATGTGSQCFQFSRFTQCDL